MKTGILGDSRGVATSLIEAITVIAIAAIVSSIAFVSATGRFDDAKLTRAVADVERMGIAVLTFTSDTGWAPVFKSGDARGLDDPIFLVLETSGNLPEAEASLDWPGDGNDRDRLENHLLWNRPAGSGEPYPVLGGIPYARMKGWNGPYLSGVPSSDPWGNRYLVNVQILTRSGVDAVAGDLDLSPGERAAAFVISAGPNGKLDTKFGQPADSFVPGEDDIIYRIQ
jgi:hypothetical protein